MSVLEGGNQTEIKNRLAIFKPGGKLSVLKTLEIPSEERIPALIKQENGFIRVAAVLGAYLKQAMENLNLRSNFNEDQLVNLIEMVIDESSYDNLGIEDVVLFLEQMVTGKSGVLYDRIDTPTFFQMFENYRQERHSALLKYRENKHLEYKGLGDPNRSTKKETAFEEHLSQFTNKLQTMKDELEEQKQENKRLRKG